MAKQDFATVVVGRLSLSDLAHALMTPHEVAEYFGRAHTSVMRWIHAGEIPHIKKADKYLIPRAACEVFVPPPMGNPQLLKDKKPRKRRKG